MWSAEHSISTSATAEAIWERWVNPSCWPEQDEGIEWAKLEGPLAVGTRISLKPKGSKVTGTTIATLEPFTRFKSQSKIPFGKLTFDHLIAADADGRTKFTHRVTISGPLTPILRRVFAEEMAAGFPTMMAKLARLAEMSGVAV